MHVHKCLTSKVQHMPTQDTNKSLREKPSLYNDWCEHPRVWKYTNLSKLSTRDIDFDFNSIARLTWDSTNKTSRCYVMKMNDLTNFYKRPNISTKGIWLGLQKLDTNWPTTLI